MELPAIVTLIALLEYLFFAFKVGFSREKYNVIAPAVSGNPIWERLYRVQQNTLEQLIVFLPALWIFSYFVSPTTGAAIGILFINWQTHLRYQLCERASQQSAWFL